MTPTDREQLEKVYYTLRQLQGARITYTRALVDAMLTAISLLLDKE